MIGMRFICDIQQKLHLAKLSQWWSCRHCSLNYRPKGTRFTPEIFAFASYDPLSLIKYYMAGKGSWKEFKDGHNSKEFHHLKDGSRHVSSPRSKSFSGPGFPSSSKVDRDGPASITVSPLIGQTPLMALEQKLAAQHAEIQRLLSENQRLAVTHVALRQEFAASQQEIMRMLQSRPFNDTEKEQRFAITQVALRQELADAKQEVNKLRETMAAIQTEKEQHIRITVEKGAQIEAELKAAMSLKANFEKLQYERDELLSRVNLLTGELKKLPIKDNEIASLKNEIDELRQRHQQARMDFEQQKKINLEHLEQKQALETKIFTLSREIDRLHSELERKLHNVYPASSGTVLPSSLHGSAVMTGSFENNLGQQEVSKSTRSVVDPPDGKASAESARFQSGRQAPLDHPPVNVESTGEWTKQAATNGKLFYPSPAAQWNKPSSNAGPEPHNSHQKQMSHAQSHQEQVSGSEPGIMTAPVQLPPSMLQQQPPPSQQAMHQGVSLLIYGLSEGITDRDLASLFHLHGTILYAKVMVDTKSGSSEYYGIITMENTQAAEAAAVAVNGMFILGRHIKVELLAKDQAIHHQQTYPQQAMQQGISQGGVGPVRWQHRTAPVASGRWPY